MIIDIFSEVFTNIKQTLSDINVISSYPKTIPVFPCVVVDDKGNTTNIRSVDSSGETHNDGVFEIQIFSNTSNASTEIRSIRNRVDAIMSDEYGMNRTLSDYIPNYADLDVSRYILRYSFTIDKTKQIFRG